MCEIIASGRILESIPKVWNGTAWASDNKTFFYMTADPAKRGDTVWRHVIGAPRGEDIKVFHEPNVLYNVSVSRSRSDDYIFISADGFTSSEWRVIPTGDWAAAPRVVAPRRLNVEYSVEHGDGFFYLVTNDNARNFRVLRAADRPGELEWTDWTPHRDDVFIEGLDVFDRFAVVTERRGGLRRLRVVDMKSSASHDITFPEAAYGVFPSGNPEFEDDGLSLQLFLASSPLRQSSTTTSSRGNEP